MSSSRGIKKSQKKTASPSVSTNISENILPTTKPSRTKTPSPIKSRVCLDCEKLFHIKAYNRHVQECHGGERRYKCRHVDCNAAFFRAKLLIEHTNAVHFKHKSYSCKFCEKEFSYMGGLSRHVKDKHTGGTSS